MCNQTLFVWPKRCDIFPVYIEGILPKGPYLPCVSMAGRALLAGYPRYVMNSKNIIVLVTQIKHYARLAWYFVSSLYWNPYPTILGLCGSNICSACQGDVMTWKYFPRNQPSWGESTGHQWIPLTKISIQSFMWSWTNGWINNGVAGDFRRHCAHVTSL